MFAWNAILPAERESLQSAWARLREQIDGGRPRAVAERLNDVAVEIVEVGRRAAAAMRRAHFARPSRREHVLHGDAESGVEVAPVALRPDVLRIGDEHVEAVLFFLYLVHQESFSTGTGNSRG